MTKKTSLGLHSTFPFCSATQQTWFLDTVEDSFPLGLDTLPEALDFYTFVQLGRMRRDPYIDLYTHLKILTHKATGSTT